MADPLKQICDELGVCKEEALFYLEGFRWDVNAATEACRSKTLPPSEDERAAAEERSRNERAAAEDLRSNELIAQFLDFAIGSSAKDAVKYLNGSNWNLDFAVKNFYYDIDNPTPWPLSRDGPTETLYKEEFSGNEGSGGGSDVMEDVLSKVPQFHNASMDLKIRNRPSASTPPPLELKQESIDQFRATFPKASYQAVIDCLNKRKGNVQDAMDYFIGDYSEEARPGIATAQVVKNFSGMAVDQDSSKESPQRTPEAEPLVTSSQVEESGNPTEETLPLKGEETLPLKGEESAEVKEEHIGSFVKMTGATREEAITHLEYFKWNVNKAVKFFEENENSGELISALSLSLMGNEEDPPLPSMGLPSQSQSESSYVSSGSMETQRSLEEGGEGDVTVANPPGMVKAHVKIQEGSRTSSEDLPEQPSQSHDDLIDLLVLGGDGVITRDIAIIYLTQSNLDLKEAYSSLLEEHNTMHSSLLEEQNTMQVQASQEGETGSSSSVPTETQRSLQEAGEGDVTVAIPGMASSQLDGKAVEEGSSTETAPDPSANKDME